MEKRRRGTDKLAMGHRGRRSVCNMLKRQEACQNENLGYLSKKRTRWGEGTIPNTGRSE